jgi:Putative auto-transporter adhesin, head GIN domain
MASETNILSNYIKTKKAMNKNLSNVRLLLIGIIASIVLNSCNIYLNDSNVTPSGKTVEQEFRLNNFTRLDMGSAFVIKVRKGSPFAIFARGDQTDINDLDVYVDRNGTLIARYKNNRSRRYRMDFDITMPDLRGIDFSGASNATIDGFRGLSSIDISLSGASKTTFNSSSDRVQIDLSGASDLLLVGSGVKVAGSLSGASALSAFDYLVEDADLDLSGASSAKVAASKTLRVTASGASSVRYIGSPDVRQSLSGGSVVRKD